MSGSDDRYLAPTKHRPLRVRDCNEAPLCLRGQTMTSTTRSLSTEDDKDQTGDSHADMMMIRSCGHTHHKQL